MIRAKIRVTGLASAPPSIELVLPPDATVGHMLDTLRTRYPPMKALWQLDYRQVAVNNKQATGPDQRVATVDGETAEIRVLVVAPIGGGCQTSLAGSGVLRLC